MEAKVPRLDSDCTDSQNGILRRWNLFILTANIFLYSGKARAAETVFITWEGGECKKERPRRTGEGEVGVGRGYKTTLY